MTSQNNVLSSLDAELTERLSSRRDAFRQAAIALGALATAPTLLAGASTRAFGQGAQLPAKIRDVLNFALTLEYLEDDFYRMGLDSEGLIPSEHRPMFERIGLEESAHVDVLKSALGDHAAKKPQFDFTAGGAFGDVFMNGKTFMAVSQAFEDLGVRAYKGQAGNLIDNDDLLTVALQIHSVEARHAAAVRELRGQMAWITSNSRGDLPPATQPIYDGEADFTQGGVDLRQLARTAQIDLSLDNLSGAFDEPLGKDEVLTIAGKFIKS